MKLVSIIALLTLSAFSFADDKPAAPKAPWTCYAQGKQGFGGPGGDFWMTTRGDGATEFEAMDQAQQSCFSQGLQMCSPMGCYKNN